MRFVLLKIKRISFYVTILKLKPVSFYVTGSMLRDIRNTVDKFSGKLFSIIVLHSSTVMK